MALVLLHGTFRNSLRKRKKDFGTDFGRQLYKTELLQEHKFLVILFLPFLRVSNFSVFHFRFLKLVCCNNTLSPRNNPNESKFHSRRN